MSKPKITKQKSCWKVPLSSDKVIFVDSDKSDGFGLFRFAIRRSVLVGMDAEWRPSFLSNAGGFPKVSLFQIACRIYDFDLEDFSDHGHDDDDEHWRQKIFANSDRLQDLIFLLDFLALPAASLWKMLKELLISRDILKLGFNFKQDLWYLSKSFLGQEEDLHGCFDKVDPYIDIKLLYDCLQHKELLISHNRTAAQQNKNKSKSLSSIFEEVLGFQLSKDFQCSDWEQRPLTDDQLAYAAADAHCLLFIFDVFDKEFQNLIQYGQAEDEIPCTSFSKPVSGLREILFMHECDSKENIFGRRTQSAVKILTSTLESLVSITSVTSAANATYMRKHVLSSFQSLMDLSKIYGERILLVQSKMKVKSGYRNARKKHSQRSEKFTRNKIADGEWQGPPPWDPSVGGDGIPKFLCDVMVEGLAKQLRCVGIDAACPSVAKTEPRQLVEQAEREGRILLTRDVKFLRRHLVSPNLAYKVEKLLKQDQLVEVINMFNLNITEEQLMSRCIKCNGTFSERTLTKDEALAVAAPKQVIPESLLDPNVEFWQCSECRQLYWEGVQYRNAIQQFSSVCSGLIETSNSEDARTK